MADFPSSLKNTLHSLFQEQYFAILATTCNGIPRSNIIAFAVSEDLRYFIFSTPKSTHKFRNLKKNPNVSIFVDNRPDHPKHLKKIIGVAATGKAEESKAETVYNLFSLYCKRHPQLKDFANSEKNALFIVTIKRYDIVKGIADVRSLHMTEKD